MIDKVQLFLEIAKIARPIYSEDLVLESLNVPLADTGLDSLDCLMIGMYMSDIYDIEEDISKEMQPTTPQEYYDFCDIHKKREPESIEQAMGWFK